MIDLDEIEKVHKGWLEASIHCSPGQRVDSTTILELVEEIRKLKKYKVAALAEMLRTRELLEECVPAFEHYARPSFNYDSEKSVAGNMLAKLRSVSPQGAPAGGGEG